jgi:hypothetical protein
MSTKRTPRSRPLKPEITATAIAAFRKMRRLRTKCTCAPVDWEGEYWKHQECPACDQWWQQHSILWHELRLKVWQWPAIQTPGACTPYPAGSYAAANWKPNLEAQERYRALERAAAEEAKQQRKGAA